MKPLILGDSLEVLIDHRGKTPKKLGSDFVPEGIPVASALLVNDGVLNLDEARHVSKQTAEKWMPIPVRKGDVLLTSEAPLGRVARVPTDEPLVLGQRLFGLRGRPGVLDSGYLYYALQTAPVQAELTGRATGTTVVGIRQSSLREVRLPAPDFRAQVAIAEVLGALDDKIAANRRSAQAAEGLAAAKYAAAVRSGSTAVELNDVATHVAGKYLKKSQYEAGGEYIVYGSNSVMGRHTEYLLEGPFSVLARIGSSCGSLMWSERPAWVNNNASAILAKDGFNPWVLRYVLETIDMSPLRLGSGQPYIDINSLMKSQVAVPLSAGGLGESLKLLSSVSSAQSDESGRLALIRDTLLPRLMSGELRVRDAEEVVSNAV